MPAFECKNYYFYSRQPEYTRKDKFTGTRYSVISNIYMGIFIL